MLDGNVLLRQKRDEVPEGTLSCPDRNLAVFHHCRRYEGLRLLPSVCEQIIIQQTLNKLCLPIVVEHSLFYTRTKDGLLQIIVYKDILNSKHTKIIVAFCSIHLSILYHLV